MVVNLPGVVVICPEWWLGPTTPDQCGQNPEFGSVIPHCAKIPLAIIMGKNMCKEVGILGSKTNHYSATALFNARVPEKVIQDRTGHRSIEGLRKYKKMFERQKEYACRALSGRSPMQCQTNSVTNWIMQVAAPIYSSQQQQ